MSGASPANYNSLVVEANHPPYTTAATPTRPAGQDDKVQCAQPQPQRFYDGGHSVGAAWHNGRLRLGVGHGLAAG